MLMGKLLAQAAMDKGYNVTWLPSYGAEVRGGTAHSIVHISSEPISSPMTDEPSIGVVMNKPSLYKFVRTIKKEGLLIVNSSMVDNIPGRKDISIAEIPLTKLAQELGNVRVANMIAIGALIRLKGFLSPKSLIGAIKGMFLKNRKILEKNIDALTLGYEIMGK